MTRAALLAISHGTSSADGRAAVRGLVDAVAARLAAGEGDAAAIRLGHVDVEQPDVPATLASLPEGQPAVIVPLLLSAGYHVHVDLREAADAASGRAVAIAPALGPDDRLAEVLARRLAEAGWRAGDAVVLSAAGSSDARAVEDCAEMGRRLAAVLGTPVVVGYLSAAEPRLADAVASARAGLAGRVAAGEEEDSPRVVVSSYLLAPGYFQDLAEQTARDVGADIVTAPLLLPDEPAPADLAAIVLDRFETGSALLSSV